MSDQDAMWDACLEEPRDETRRLALADLLQELGLEDMARAFRGHAGRTFLRAAADVPDGDLTLKLYGMTSEEREKAIRGWIEDTIEFVLENEPARRAIAQTNATDWQVDHCATRVTGCFLGTCQVRVTFTASGEQDPAREALGNRIRGVAEAHIDATGDVEYEVVEVHVIPADG